MLGGGDVKEWLISLIKCAFNTEHGLWVETSERVGSICISFPLLLHYRINGWTLCILMILFYRNRVHLPIAVVVP